MSSTGSSTLAQRDSKFIEISDVEQTFKTPKGSFQALRDINLNVAKGEFVALIGHSGCGKSTLLNLIAGLQNKTKMAETIADKAYVNTGVDAINQRILGRYQNGLGKTWDDPNYMKFFNDGAVNFPYLSDGMWFLTQHKRWGLLKEHPDYLKVAQEINQIELYKQVASAMKVSVPKDSMRSSKLIDGVVWDGKDPKKYADSFKIKA